MPGLWTSVPLRPEDLNPAWLKRTYFFGIALKDEDDNDLSDDVIAFYINRAFDEMEGTLDVHIRQRTVTAERYDYNRDQWRNFSFLQLRHRPVRAVTAMSLMSGSANVFAVPVTGTNSWVRLEPRWGQVHLYPALGSIASIDAGALLSPILSQFQWAPHVIETTYTTGMDEIESDLADAIGMTAAVNIFNILGNLIIGAGIASFSLGLDGLSQSVSSTQSAMFAGFSSTVLEFRRELKGFEQGRPGLVDRLRSKWRKPVFSVL